MSIDTTMLRLPLTPIGVAPSCYDRLEEIEAITPGDLRRYEETGWGDFRPEWHRTRPLPELGPPRYFSREDPVLPLAGRRFVVSVESDYRDDPWSADGKYLVLTPTEAPETVHDRDPPGDTFRGHHAVHAFGQPHWIQGECHPAGTDGEPCRHLLTIENVWGDNGNWNVLVALGQDGLPAIAYFEASCC